MNIVKQIGGYFTSSFQELTKVVWPSRRDVVNHTVAIIVAVIFTVVVFGLLDLGLLTVLRTFILNQ